MRLAGVAGRVGWTSAALGVATPSSERLVGPASSFVTLAEKAHAQNLAEEYRLTSKWQVLFRDRR